MYIISRSPKNIGGTSRLLQQDWPSRPPNLDRVGYKKRTWGKWQLVYLTVERSHTPPVYHEVPIHVEVKVRGRDETH